MPLNGDCIGRVYPAPETYEVSREIIRNFARAVGDTHPVYTDVEVAKGLGYRDVIAPPTFLTVLRFRFNDSGPLTDPDLGLDYSKVLHGEQRFVHHRPTCAGDVLTAKTTIVSIREAGDNELVLTETSVTASGEPVCDIYNTTVSRGTAAKAGR